jgi:probable HAF family extracellular repeat protein
MSTALLSGGRIMGNRRLKSQPGPAAALVSALLTLACGSASAQVPYRLTILGGDATPASAVDINNNGQVVLNTGSAVVWDGTTFTDLGAGSPLAINNAGQVVGTTTDSLTLPRAAAWLGAGASRLPGPVDENNSAASDINDHGQIAGFQRVGGRFFYATTWENGGYSNLGLGIARGINNSGQIVGISIDPTLTFGSAALWDRNGMTLLGGRDTAAVSINDRGQIVGYSASHAQLWDGARAIDLGTLSGDNSFAAAINNAGQVVGSYGFNPSSGLDSRAALWNGTVGTDLNSLLRPESVQAGWFLTFASGINDSGTIVGSAYNRFDCADGSCVSHGFVLSISDLPDQVLAITTAVPEPSSYALMLAGLGAIGLWAQCRRAACASE